MKRPQRILSRTACLLTGVLLTLAPLAAQEKPAGPIVELPKFVVTDSRELLPPEAWRHAEIPGFEILSSATDRSTRQLIRDFILFKQALGLVLPLPAGDGAPTALILCGRRGNFATFVPSGKSTADSTLASIYLGGREQSAIVIDFGNATLDLVGQSTSDTEPGVDASRLSVDHNKQLYREYVHHLLGRGEPRPPAWLEEGMAQIVMAMKFDRENIIFGQLEDPNEISAAAGQIANLNAADAAAGLAADPNVAAADAPIEDRDFNAALRHQALIPMLQLFASAHDSPEALNPLGNNRWAKQSYAFVHMCLYGQNGRYQKPFAQFLARLSRAPVSEAMFQDCFKMSTNAMLDELRGYIGFANYKQQEYHAKKGEAFAEPPPLELRDGTQAEVGRMKGEALMLAGHADLARAELRAAYIRGERDPALLAALGIFDHATGEDDQARKFLEAAVAANVVRPAAYLALAQIRFADATAKPEGADGSFSPAQFSRVQELLLTARKQPPSLAGVYELLADAWAHTAVKPKKEDVAVLVEGVRTFPTRLKLLYQASVFCVDADMNDIAVPLVDYGLKIAPDAKSRAPFEKLKATLPAAARPPGR